MIKRILCIIYLLACCFFYVIGHYRFAHLTQEIEGKVKVEQIQLHFMEKALLSMKSGHKTLKDFSSSENFLKKGLGYLYNLTKPEEAMAQFSKEIDKLRSQLWEDEFISLGKNIGCFLASPVLYFYYSSQNLPKE